MAKAPGTGLLRRRLKRARERVYLEHFLACRGLVYRQLIEGMDDGREPDFSCLIEGKWIGIELTTLPRLRDRVGNHQLLWKRWYWRTIALTGLQPAPWVQRLERSVSFNGRSAEDWEVMENIPVPISQQDIDAVLSKKKRRYPAYLERRPLDELWLLIHTDQQQPEGVLVVETRALHHGSKFQQVWLSRYPSRELIRICY